MMATSSVSEKRRSPPAPKSHFEERSIAWDDGDLGLARVNTKKPVVRTRWYNENTSIPAKHACWFESRTCSEVRCVRDATRRRHSQ